MNASWYIKVINSLADTAQQFSWENEKRVLIEIIVKGDQKVGENIIEK